MSDQPNTEDHLSIQNLVDLSGVSRRTVRYYVQRGLIPPPEGAGRGHYYTRDHLEQLQRVRAMQQAGHSLNEIAALIGDVSGAVRELALHFSPAASPAPRKAESIPEVSLTTRIHIADGVELLVSPPSKVPDPKRLAELAQAIQLILEGDGDDNDDRN